MSRGVGPLSLLAVLGACASEPRPPVAASEPRPPVAASEPRPPVAAPLVVPPIAANRECDERDPTPDAVPETAAPPALTQLDSEVRAMQSGAGKYVYTGSVADVVGDGKGSNGAFGADAIEAITFARRIEREVVEKAESPEWTVVALTHEAEVLERPRDALAKLQVHEGPGPQQPGEIELLTAQQKALLARMNAMQSRLANKADELEDAVRDYWKQKRKMEVESLDERMVTAYARAAKDVDTKNPAATRAVRRLGHYTRELGNERMAKLLGESYVPDVYLRMCAELDAPKSR